MPRKKSTPIDESYSPDPVVEQDEEVQEVAMDVEPEPEVKSVDPEPDAIQKTDERPKATVFRTREQESVAFQIRVGANKVRGGRNMHDGFVYWRVPADLIELFKQTPHVLQGRIVEDK